MASLEDLKLRVERAKQPVSIIGIRFRPTWMNVPVREMEEIVKRLERLDAIERTIAWRRAAHQAVGNALSEAQLKELNIIDRAEEVDSVPY